MADIVQARVADSVGTGIPPRGRASECLADSRLAESTRDAYRRALRPYDEWRGDRPCCNAALAEYVSCGSFL